MQKFQIARGSTQCESGPGNKMVCRRTYLLYIFQKQFSITAFMQQDTFEKN